MKLLIVEIDIELCLHIKEVLESNVSDISVECAHNQTEAKELLNVHEFDIVLWDYSLFRFGVDLTVLSKIGKAKLVLMTSYPSRYINTLRKPFSLDDLLEVTNDIH